MASDEQRELKKGLLKKDKLELVKILKSKNQPTNGGKADLVERILAHDEKTGGKMARKASVAAKPGSDGEDDDYEPYEEEEEEEEDDDEYEEEAAPVKKKKSKPKSKPKQKKKNNNTGGGGGGGGGGGAGIECGDCSPNIDRGPGLIGVAQIATALAAIGQLILGIIQFVLLAEALEVCLVDVYDGCLGKSLFWEPVFGEDTDDFNAHWRYVFTFRPSYFFANWTPMLFGLIAMMQMFYSTSWYFVSGTWIRCMFFHLIMILFAALPYCGKAGIVIGFVQVFAGFMCLIMAFMDRGGGATYLMFGW